MNTKRVFKWFDIAHYEEEATYLRDMHRQGWRLTRVSFPGVYTFECCEPEDVVYQLDYNQEGVQHKAEYTQMFADCGWEYLFDYVGYSYFRKPAAQMEGEASIFCDDASRLEMMKRVFQGRMLPILVLFLCVIVPQFFLLASDTGSTFRQGLFVFYAAMLVVYILLFATMGMSFLHLKKKMGK